MTLATTAAAILHAPGYHLAFMQKHLMDPQSGAIFTPDAGFPQAKASKRQPVRAADTATPNLQAAITGVPGNLLVRQGNPLAFGSMLFQQQPHPNTPSSILTPATAANALFLPTENGLKMRRLWPLLRLSCIEGIPLPPLP